MEKPVSRDLKWLNSITWQVRGKPGQDPDPRLPPLPFYRSSLLSSLLILFCHLKKPNPQGFSEAHEGLWVGLDWGNEKGRGLGGNEKQGQATFYDAPFCLWAPNPVCGVCVCVCVYVCVCVCVCVFTLWGRRCEKTLFQAAWRIQPPTPPSSEISPSLLISLLSHALMLTFPALEFAGSSLLYFHTTSSE